MTAARHALARHLGSAMASRATETHWGVVRSVQAGPPKTITVTVNGSTEPVAGVGYLAGYVPAVGDNVLLLLLGSDSRARQSWVAVDSIDPATGSVPYVTVNEGPLYWTDPRVGGAVDGVTDNGRSGTDALAKAYTLLSSKGGTLFVPPGDAALASAPSQTVCPSAVRIEGAGKAASAITKTYAGPLLDMSGTSTTSRCQRGGLANIMLSGGNSSGPLLHMSYADHFDFDNVFFYNTADVAVLATELWDTYFHGCEFEYVGTTAAGTGAAVRLLSSATDSTNEIYFAQCRWESFPGTALMVDSNGSTHAPYGIWLSQSKMESAFVHGPAFIDMTGDVTDLHVKDIYLAGDALAPGGTPTALVDFIGYAACTLEGVHAFCNGGSVDSVIYCYPGAVGHSIRDVYVDAPTLPGHGIIHFGGGNPLMDVENVRYAAGQSGGTGPGQNGIVYQGTVPSNVVLRDLIRGGVPAWTAMQTAAYSARAFDAVPCDTTGGGFAVTLPAATINGIPVRVKWVAGTAAPTVTAAAGATIDSAWSGFGAVGQSATFSYNAPAGVWELV